MWGISAGRTRCAAVCKTLCGEMFPALNRGQERVLRLLFAKINQAQVSQQPPLKQYCFPVLFPPPFQPSLLRHFQSKKIQQATPRPPQAPRVDFTLQQQQQQQQQHVRAGAVDGRRPKTPVLPEME